MNRQQFSLLLLLSLASISLCFDTIYGSVSAEDAMSWIQQSQPAADGSDAMVRWFWNQNDAKMHPARKAAANPVYDIHTPWLDPVKAGQLFGRSLVMGRLRTDVRDRFMPCCRGEFGAGGGSDDLGAG